MIIYYNNYLPNFEIKIFLKILEINACAFRKRWSNFWVEIHPEMLFYAYITNVNNKENRYCTRLKMHVFLHTIAKKYGAYFVSLHFMYVYTRSMRK